MKRFLYIIAAIIGVFFIILLVVHLRSPSHPLAFIKVADPLGKPIIGAVITPDGLRPKRGGGHYLWGENRNPKPAAVATDAQGMAAIRYPFYTEERLETEQISFRVEHPDYCSDRPFRTVNTAPPANARLLEKLFYWVNVMIRNTRSRPAAVVLKPGAIVEASGYIHATNDSVAPLYAQVSKAWDYGTNLWRQIAPGLLASRKIPEGNCVLRLVHIPGDGRPYFSEPVSFGALPGMTNRFHLSLKPGGKVIGKLDDSVPRPVTGGRAVLVVFPSDAEPRGDTVRWHAWSSIDTNGAFSIDGLPPGRVEIVALCDGYVSEDGKSARRGTRSPQEFMLADGETTVQLAMEPTATFRLTVTDDRGRPIPDAKVTFWPNVIWGGNGTTIFCADLYNTLEAFTRTTPSEAAERKRREEFYTATTNQRGIALVTNLPAHADSYTVSHAKFEMPIRKSSSSQVSRERSVRLRPGETVRQSVSLQKRGRDYVEHKR